MSEPSSIVATSTPTSSKGTAHEVVLGALSSAFVELACHYGIEIEAVRASDTPELLTGHQVAGIIGFAGASLSGTVSVQASSALVRGCMPVVPRSGRESQALGDWIAELANQLLGRTKNKLVRYGDTFQLTPPTYAAAEELIVLSCDPARTTWLAVTTQAGLLLVMLELRAPADFNFVLADDVPVAHAEGDVMLF